MQLYMSHTRSKFPRFKKQQGTEAKTSVVLSDVIFILEKQFVRCGHVEISSNSLGSQVKSLNLAPFPFAFAMWWKCPSMSNACAMRPSPAVTQSPLFLTLETKGGGRQPVAFMRCSAFVFTTCMRRSAAAAQRWQNAKGDFTQ